MHLLMSARTPCVAPPGDRILDGSELAGSLPAELAVISASCGELRRPSRELVELENLEPLSLKF